MAQLQTGIAMGSDPVETFDGPQDAVADGEIDKSLAEIARQLPLDRESDVLTRQEQDVLELYQELKEVELEKAILSAESEANGDPMETDDEDETLKAAQKELLEARALYNIRQNVVDDILQADPVLKSVHAGSAAAPAERTLHPLIVRRDILAMCQSCLSSMHHETRDALTLETAQNLRSMETNRTLAAEVLELASQLKEHELDDLHNDALREKLETSEARAKESRRQYRIVKGVMGGLIAGSGVDWAKNQQLRDLLLDTDD